MDAGTQSFYGFTRSPFGPVDDESTQLIPAHSRNELVHGVVTDVLVGRPVVAIEGEQGVGKSILVSAIAATLSQHGFAVVRLSGVVDGPLHVQQLIGDAVGVADARSWEPPRLVRDVEAVAAGKLVVLLFDDADVIPQSVFRYLWLLQQLFNFGQTQLHLVLVGGIGRWPGMEHPDLEGLRQAAGKFFVIKPLGDDEAAYYLDRKLRLAGGSLRRVMTNAATAELLEIADGIPGQIDALAERVLQRGYLAGRRRINVPTLQKALFREAPPPLWALRPGVSAWVGGAAVLAVMVILGAVVATGWDVAGWHARPADRATELAAIPQSAAPPRSVPEPKAGAEPQSGPESETGFAATSPPEPPPAPSAAPDQGVPAAPEVSGETVLPPPPIDPGTPIRVALAFPQNDAAAEASARAVAAALQAEGIQVTGPIPASRRTSPRISFFFASDRAAAASVGDTVTRVTGIFHPVTLARRDVLPPPGTVELTVASP